MKKSILKRILSLIFVILMLCIPLMTAACIQLLPDDGNQNNNPNDSDNSGVLKDPDRKAFIDDIGGVSEKFTGTVSQTSYASSDEAAKAYVSEEIAGNDTANISSVKSNGKLSKEEINKCNIPADILNGCDTVEEVEVVYELITPTSSSGSSNVVKLSSNKYTIKVYVIKFGVNWKYFAPMPVTGNTINKSYYDSVFNAEKYKNCTLEATSEADMVLSADGLSINMSIKIKQLIKYDDGKIYMEQTTIQTTDGETEKQTIYAYFEEVNNIIICYIRLNQNDDWIVTDITSIGFNSLEELTPFYDQYLDYTYFKKTAYGFELSDENARSYFKQALMGVLDGMGLDLDKNSLNVDMYAEYYVSEGVLSGMRVDANVDLKFAIDESTTGTITEKAIDTIKCTDYGTTIVNIPDVDM